MLVKFAYLSFIALVSMFTFIHDQAENISININTYVYFLSCLPTEIVQVVSCMVSIVNILHKSLFDSF